MIEVNPFTPIYTVYSPISSASHGHLIAISADRRSEFFAEKAQQLTRFCESTVDNDRVN